MEGVAKRSLARLSVTPSCDSEPLVAKDNRTGSLSLGRPDTLTTSEEARKKKERTKGETQVSEQKAKKKKERKKKNRCSQDDLNDNLQ